MLQSAPEAGYTLLPALLRPVGRLPERVMDSFLPALAFTVCRQGAAQASLAVPLPFPAPREEARE